ncbi:MAG: hypothetical protein WKG03_00275 [Telluria sp.]
MQFYPADWRKDLAVQALCYHDRGVWFEMLCLMHESSERGVLLLAGQPMPEDVAARLLGLDNQTFKQTLSNLLTYGVAKLRDGDHAVFSKRMVADESLCEIRRKSGKLGGNPALLNQKVSTPVKQSPTPSSSSSSSSSDSKDTPANAALKKASSPITLQAYIEQCETAGLDPIPADDAAFAYADTVGLSHSFLKLHWAEFKERNCAPGAKRQKSWRQTFGNSVRGNWFKIWYIDTTGGYALSTVGQQAKRQHGGAA